MCWFFLVLWKYCTIYFDHIITFPPTTPRSQHVPTQIHAFLEKHIRFNSWCTYIHGYMSIHKNTVHLPVATTLKTSSISSSHLPIAPQIWVGLHDHLSSKIGILSGLSLLGSCECRHNLSSSVQLLYSVPKPMISLFYCSHPALMDLINFLFHFLNDHELCEDGSMR